MLFQESSSATFNNINDSSNNNNNNIIDTCRYQLSIYFLLQCYEHRLSAILHTMDATLSLSLAQVVDSDGTITSTTATLTTPSTAEGSILSSSSSSSLYDLPQSIQQLIHTLISKRIKLIAIDHAMGFFSFIYHILLIHCYKWNIDDLEQIIDDCSYYQQQIMRTKEVRKVVLDDALKGHY